MLHAWNSPLYLTLALLRKHFSVFASPLTMITGGSRASSSNLPSRPLCFGLTDETDVPTSPGETPRNLVDFARFGEGEVEADLHLLLPLPLEAPPPRLPPSRDRLRVVVAGDLDWDRRRLVLELVGDPRPLLRLVAAVTPLEWDLDRDRVRLALESDEARSLELDLDLDTVVEGLDTVVEATARVWAWVRARDRDRDRERERDRERDRDRERCRDLDRLCSVCGRLGLLDGRLPYLLPLVSACCGCLPLVSVLDVESTAVAGVSVVVSESPCPGDPGGVELVTGANTSLLTFTSQSPVVLYLRASSANNT